MPTLAQSIESSFIDFEVLEQRYEPMLALVRELIGVVPNCDSVLEIWPPGFRSYNLIVPNMLNLPVALVRRPARKRLVGLAMYTSSRAAECAYCSAHCCSFALRRGVGAAAIVGDRSPAEAAVVSVAEGLSRLPADVSAADVAALRRQLSPADVDWVVMGIAMMGFLNKFMDAMGIELEPEAIDDVAALIGPTGWTPGQHMWRTGRASKHALARQPPVDSARTYGRVLRHGPAAARLEHRWTRNVPSRPDEANGYLRQRTGAELPVLAHLPSGHAVRAITTVLADNLDPAQSATGITIKGLAGLVFATVAGNTMLAEQARRIVLATDPAFDQSRFDTVVAWARAADPSSSSVAAFSEIDAAVLALAKAAAPSPAAMTPAVITSTVATLTPAQIVEAVVWLSVQQLLHRIDTFHAHAV